MVMNIKTCLGRGIRMIPKGLNAVSRPHRRLLGRSIPGVLLVLFALGVVTGCTFRAGHIWDEEEASGLPTALDLNTLATQTQQTLPKLEVETTTPFTPATKESELTATPARTPLETAVPATPTSTVNSPLPRKPTEIRFRRGGTLAVLKEEISAGEKHTYTLRAMNGQTMILGVSSDHQDVVLGLKGLSGGQDLLPLSDQSSSTSVTLPETQDYQITLYASGTDTVYFLRIEVPAEIDVAPGEGPVFVDGRIDILELSSPYDTRVRYLIDVEKGRRLKVNLEMPGSDDFTLALYGQEDGQPYLKNVQANSIDLEVPTTQGYYVDVHSRTPGAFTLRVEIY